MGFPGALLRAALLAGVAAGVAVNPVAAQAQGGAQHASVEEDARRAFEAGVAAARRDALGEARAAFERSCSLLAKPTTLLNLALVDLQLGDAPAALAALDELDALAQGPEHARVRERARALRAEAHAALGTAPAAAAPPEGGAPPEVAPAALASHEAALRAPLAATPAAPLEGPHTTPLQETHALAPGPQRSRRGPRALLAAAGVLTAGAIASGLWLRGRNQAVDACSAPDGRTCREQDAIDAERTAAVALTAGLATAGGALFVGSALWTWRRHRSEAPRLASTWQLMPHGLGLSARGRF